MPAGKRSPGRAEVTAAQLLPLSNHTSIVSVPCARNPGFASRLQRVAHCVCTWVCTGFLHQVCTGFASGLRSCTGFEPDIEVYRPSQCIAGQMARNLCKNRRGCGGKSQATWGQIALRSVAARSLYCGGSKSATSRSHQASDPASRTISCRTRAHDGNRRASERMWGGAVRCSGIAREGAG